MVNDKLSNAIVKMGVPGCGKTTYIIRELAQCTGKSVVVSQNRSA